MAKIVAVVEELMLASRVSAILGAAGHEVVGAPDLASADLLGAELIVADLHESDPAALAAAGPPVLGFYRHTEPGVKQRADEAGVELSVPRSRLVREMPELVERLLDHSQPDRRG